jgi:hypothetical protein
MSSNNKQYCYYEGEQTVSFPTLSETYLTCAHCLKLYKPSSLTAHFKSCEVRNAIIELNKNASRLGSDVGHSPALTKFVHRNVVFPMRGREYSLEEEEQVMQMFRMRRENRLAYDFSYGNDFMRASASKPKAAAANRARAQLVNRVKREPKVAAANRAKAQLMDRVKREQILGTTPPNDEDFKLSEVDLSYERYKYESWKAKEMKRIRDRDLGNGDGSSEDYEHEPPPKKGKRQANMLPTSYDKPKTKNCPVQAGDALSPAPVNRRAVDVHLVYADSKIRLKEFEKDGKIYVEAEPGVEYFIAIRRVDMEDPSVILANCYVDGKYLGYQQSFSVIDPEPHYTGFWSRVNGIDRHTTLQFAKPSPAKPGKGYKGEIGRIEVLLHKGIYKASKQRGDAISSTELDPTVDVARATLRNQKFLLTAPGTTTRTNNKEGSIQSSYTKGALIDRITLYYCSALGMIENGVIPKPGSWTLHRMIYPVQPGQLRARFDLKPRPEHSEEGKEIEIVDLTDDSKPAKFTW